MKTTNRANRAAKRYMREVRRNLPCSFKTKRELLARLQDSLLDFVGERPHASYEDITEHFGVPTDVADMYFADLPAAQLRKALQTARFVRRLLLAACLLAFLLYAVTLGVIIYENHNDGPGIYVQSIEDHGVIYEYTVSGN